MIYVYTDYLPLLAIRLATAAAIAFSHIQQNKSRLDSLAFLNNVLAQLNEAKAQHASMDMIKKAFDEVEQDLSLQSLLEERQAFIEDTQRLLARLGVTSQDSVMFLNGKLIEYNNEQVSPKSIFTIERISNTII